MEVPPYALHLYPKSEDTYWQQQGFSDGAGIWFGFRMFSTQFSWKPSFISITSSSLTLCFIFNFLHLHAHPTPHPTKHTSSQHTITQITSLISFVFLKVMYHQGRWCLVIVVCCSWHCVATGSRIKISVNPEKHMTATITKWWHENKTYGRTALQWAVLVA